MSRHKETKPKSRQLEFDYAREDRRNLINHIQIPSFHYVNTRGRRVYVHGTTTMKDLLKVIEDHCGIDPDDGWYLFMHEIANEMSVNERTACRAIADCVGGGLLQVRRSFYKHKRSHYQIVWAKVSEIIRGNPETEKWAPPDTSSDNVTHDKPPATHDKIAFTHDKLSLTHDKLSLPEGGDTSSSRARGLTNGLPNNSPPCSDQKPNRYAGYAGWPFKIELAHLKNSEATERLWKAAKERRDVELIDSDREHFYALARFVRRLTELGEIGNPGGYFHRQVMAKNWVGERRDYEAARDAMRYVDCRGGGKS